MNTALALRLSLLVAFAASCSGSGAAGAGGGAAAGGGGTASGGGSQQGRTVTITRTVKWIGEQAPQTDSQLPASLGLFLADGSALTELPGTRSATQYVVPNVPAGDYVVRTGRSFLVSNTDTLDLGYDNLGRIDVEAVDAGFGTLTLAVGGLPPWTSTSDLQFFSAGAALYGYGGVALISGPSEGQVPSSFTFDYGALATPRLDGSKGDTLEVALMNETALVTTPVAGAAEDGGTADVPFTCQVLTSAAHLTGLTIRPGPNAATATFTAPPTTQVGIIFPRTQWAARATEAHPSATVTGEYLFVAAEPVTYSNSADLVACSNFPQGGGNPVSDINRTVTVNNPFPSAWQRVGVAQVTYRMSKAVGSAGSWSSISYSEVHVPAGDPLAPGVHPPQGVRVQSVAAEQLETATAASPVAVTWTPSAVAPVANTFRVRVEKLTKNSAGIIVRVAAASAFTRGNQFTFPAGTLEVGGIYAVRVEAHVDSATPGKPYAGVYSSLAQAMTNPFLAQ